MRKHGKANFNCGTTSGKMRVTITISNLCDCLHDAQREPNLSDVVGAGRERIPRPHSEANEFASEEEAQGSVRSFQACLETKQSGLCADEVKLIRAQGECLGTESRRRTRQAAISHGEEQISIDPWISEWGNPAGQYPVSVH